MLLVVLAKILFPLLVTKTLLVFLVLFALVYTPLVSFVSARLIGLVGQTISIPYVHEATIFLSGFKGIDIWFVPFPLHNYGGQAAKFREIELTGTRFTSILKAEVFMVPIVLITSFLYWSYIWKLAPIPSESYPYVQLMWPLRALQRCVWITSTMRGELEVKEKTVTWNPANLTKRDWWYWRARATDEVDVKDPEARRYGPWTKTGYFYTDFEDEGPPPFKPTIPSETEAAEAPFGRGNRPPSAPTLVGPTGGLRVDTPIPTFTVEAAVDPEGDPVKYYFEVDQVASFDGAFLQTSDDRPILFEAIKPKIIGTGFVIGIIFFIILSIFGLPILLVFGYVRALTQIPHYMITEIIGALLARFYFWKRYGRQQWRLYATVLIVGFSVGMALVGMASVSIAMIQKSVSVLLF